MEAAVAVVVTAGNLGAARVEDADVRVEARATGVALDELVAATVKLKVASLAGLPMMLAVLVVSPVLVSAHDQAHVDIRLHRRRAGRARGWRAGR